ncbi:VWA domain-containing protein [soil metagenome]
MSYLAPERLWLLLAVIALIVAYVAMQRRRSAYAVRFTNVALLDVVAPKRPGWRRHLPAVLFLLAATTLIVAFARPARDEQVPRERATIILAIDTSLSMEATDVEPNRLAAAQDAAVAFLDIVPDTLNVGLVSFDGLASVRVPPTTDRDEVRRAVSRLELGESTAIGEGIYASLDAIEAAPPSPDSEPVPARIILMSDGETTVGRPDDGAAREALEADVPVSTIAFGTDAGFVEIDGETVPVPVNESSLESVADITGGTFFRAVTAGELTDVYQDIGSSVGFATEQREITQWFIGIGLALLLITAGASLALFSRLP